MHLIQDQERIRILGKKKNPKFLEILEADAIKQTEMKFWNNKKERRTKKFLEIKLYSRNLIKEINIWAVHHVRYSELWKEQRQMDQRTRTLMTMLKALRPRNDMDSMCQGRNEEDTPVSKIALVHQYKDSKSTLKWATKKKTTNYRKQLITAQLASWKRKTITKKNNNKKQNNKNLKTKMGRKPTV